jgi:LPPG:FO 2-phospho-L-lactate transferase
MTKTYLALCGGVGGSKLADGLARILSPEELTIAVNTADDFDHLGLRICPDIDTVTYMLGELVHPERGWGRADETWFCMEVLRSLGGEAWFQLGDRDLALHLFRTQRLQAGNTLTEITAEVCARLGVRHAPVPMSEDPVSTIIGTDQGELSFQDYFVRFRCMPKAGSIRYAGSDQAKPSKRFIHALRSPDLAGIVIAPSNPILSIAPILALPGIRQTIADREIPVVAVSPLIGGRAVKGPADKLMAELRHPPGNVGIASFYGDLIDGLLIDRVDEAEVGTTIRTRAGDILMKNAADRERVARLCLEMLHEIAR